jgi:NAD(P)-dependent dehydrogenase (short-subunit alcohol dehydrogenase family)
MVKEESRDMPQEKKLALVTGANKGIGLELARQLGRNGMIVLLGARDTKLAVFNRYGVDPW